MLSWININLDAVRNNLEKIRDNIEPETKIIAVIKSNAYGHGLVEIARTVWAAGADTLAVADVDEGIQLRIAKIRAPILVLGYTQPSEYQRVIEHGLQITLFNREDVTTLAKTASSSHAPLRVHIKIDTGLHRLGVNPNDVADFARAIKQEPYLILEAIYSHFADSENTAYSREQVKELQSALFLLQQGGFEELPPVHMASSTSISKYPEAHFDAVRPGAALYGIAGGLPGLGPVLKWSTKIVQVKRVSEGSFVGYGLTHKTQRIASLAVLPVGYADGYPRSLSNKAEVLFNGKRVKVVGTIGMNMTVVDVTGLNAKVGDQVVLIGQSLGDIIRVEDLAKWASTNPREIITRIPPTTYRHFCESEDEELE